MDEFELIRRYFVPLGLTGVSESVALGIGDDCALLDSQMGRQWTVSCDTLVCGRHFPLESDPFLLGQRALAVAVSDLAAMGADPVGFMLALTLPQADPDWLQPFARGLAQMARQCGLCLIGGDTTRGPLAMTLTVFGSTPVGKALRRDGAQIGDCLCIGEALGEAGVALALLDGRLHLSAEQSAYWLDRYWRPSPQLALGLLLRDKATAVIDVSDGLLADCEHIATASGVMLVVEQNQLTTQPPHGVDNRQMLEWQMSAGDDYVLAFTLPPRHLEEIRQAWPSMQVIGRVETGLGVRVIDAQGNRVEPAYKGYRHFMAE